MKNTLKNLNTKIIRLLKEIGQEAERRHRKAYVVGGFVRDALSKRKNLDLDIVVEGDAISVVQALAKKKRTKLIVYKQFLTATLFMPKDMHVDLATARKERYAHSGALPDVIRGTIEDDLFRRDFTINAMAVVISSDKFGLLVDVFHGHEDLKNKKIRILHDKSFIDDPTRILRAVRFEQRFGFSMEHNTLKRLKEAIDKDVIKNVKLPRYFEEFRKILNEPKPAKYLKRMHELNAFRFLSGFQWNQNAYRLIKGFETALNGFKRKFPKITFDRSLVYFMALVAQMSESGKEKIGERFQLSKEERKSLLSKKALEKTQKKLSAVHLRPSEVYKILKPLCMETIIFLSATAKSLKVRQRIHRFLKEHRSIELKIKGRDLQQLGIKPGQEMGILLKKLLYEKIDRRINSHAQELKEAKLLLSKTKGSSFPSL